MRRPRPRHCRIGHRRRQGVVSVRDLLELIGSFGPCDANCPADFDGDGFVGVPDLLALIANFGPCHGTPCVWDVNGNGVVGPDVTPENVIRSIPAWRGAACQQSDLAQRVRLMRSWGVDGGVDGSQTRPVPRPSLGRWLRIRLATPERWRLFGRRRGRPQPAGRLADGSTIALY